MMNNEPVLYIPFGKGGRGTEIFLSAWLITPKV